MDEYTDKKVRSIHESAKRASKRNYPVYNSFKRELEILDLTSNELDHEIRKLCEELRI